MLRIIHYSSPFVDLAVFGLQNSLFLLIARNAINDIQFSDLNIVHLSIQGLYCYAIHAMLNVQKKYIKMQCRYYIRTY